MVAIKKVENVFEQISFAKRTLREIKILRHLHHDNILGISDMFVTEAAGEFSDVYIVTELFETDLASVLKSPQKLSDEHVRLFMYQILRGLKCIHGAGIIHRDLKPRNVLVNSSCDVKICDFGLARLEASLESCELSPLTDYVCTRWFRAPEVLCSWRHYDRAIDMWSLGCVFAEIARRRPIFTGHNTTNQLQLIVEVVGKPTDCEIALVRKFLNALSWCPRSDMNRLLLLSDLSAAPVLDGLLQWSPARRLTVDSALALPFFSGLHDPSDEPLCPSLCRGDFEFEMKKHSKRELRSALYNEMLTFSQASLNSNQKM